MADSSADAKSNDESNKKESGSWLSAPQRYGDYAGEQIEGTLGVVGKPVGQGLSQAVAPMGNVVGAVVKPVMILGDTMNDAPEWGPRAETSARKTAGDLIDSGKETLRSGREEKSNAEGGGATGENDKAI